MMRAEVENARVNAWGGPPRSLRWIPVVIALLVQLVVGLFALTGGGRPGDIAAVAAAMLSSIALLWLRRHPGPTLVLIALLTLPTVALTTLPVIVALPLAFAVIGATAQGARAWVWATVGGALLLALVLGFIAAPSPRELVRPLVVLLVLSVLVGIGEAARNRRERFLEYRAEAARRRQGEAERERVRIARELHDVLAHSLSSINVQAGVGLHLIDEQPEKAAEALANIKQTSKAALEEVRGVLGFLRGAVDEPESDRRTPQPQLERLPALLDSFAVDGLPVEVTGTAPEGLPQLAELTVYRVVQEALTNVSRHSTSKRAGVDFALDGGICTVTVRDDGATPADAALVEGRGLLGMRERAALVGGTLEAGWQPGGGFRVVLRLPATPGAES
ncbi:sensor histidine kinase [Microterricola viridarii]|uniref:histidine kinase n=1 Tax=Microterricola viridarii TaxID=412690 RepID=A0A1H1VK61_9MICO|nr:sensor histidine kinase [Microterricola viridarii]SDS85278.1 Signal transduction histidine kinase [Microterricola viridarii]